ncbi:phage late control D family protein [Bradyrhizobium denitrificans]
MTTGYTPIYRIMKDGVDITGQFNDRTLQIKVDLQAGNGNDDQCTVLIDDRDWRIARPLTGDVLGVWLGYVEVGMAYMGTFEIDDVTFLGPPRQIKLTGKSTGSNDIQKAPVIREFDNKSIGDILGQMAGQTGLGVSISEGLAGIKIPFKNQGVSNLHMIHELERLTGAVAKVVDGKLMFIKRDGAETASGVALPTLVLQPEHFGTWQVRYTAKPGYGQVKASYFDKDEMVRKWVGSVVGGEVGGPGLANKFGGAFNIGQLFNSKEEAEKAAASQAENFKRAEVNAQFDLAKGDPWIRDQQTLIVSGMRDGINGSYVIDKATHTYVKSTGIKSNLECKAPGNGTNFEEASKEFMRPMPGELLGEYLRTHPNVNRDDLSREDIDAINQGGFVN